MKEDGTFHGDAVVPHKGLSEEEMRACLVAAGLSVAAVTEVYALRRNGVDYPVFLATAQPSGAGTVTPSRGT